MDTHLPEDDIVDLIDPDDAFGEALTALLGAYNINVRTFPDAETFLAAHAEQCTSSSCLMVEVDLPGMDGLSLLKKLQARDFRPPVVVLSSAANPDIRRQAQRFGVIDVVEKPLIKNFLLGRISQLMPDESRPSHVAWRSVELRDGSRITIRVMRPEDAAIEQEFVRQLSDRARYLRFFSGLKQLSPCLLQSLTSPEFPETYALLASTSDDGQERQIGVSRYAPTDVDGVAEFAVVVADYWQGLGVGSLLLRGVTVVATLAGIERLDGLILRENHQMLRLARKLGFNTACGSDDDPSVLRVSKGLRIPIRPPGKTGCNWSE